MERVVSLRQHGLGAQNSLLVGKTLATGDMNYVAQCLPFRAVYADQADNALYKCCLEVVGIGDDEDNLNASRWFLPLRDGGMGLYGIYHSAEPLFVDGRLRALQRGADRHGFPTADVLLRELPSLEARLHSQVAAMHTKGVEDASSLEDLFLASVDGPGSLAKKWRREICTR